MVQYRRNDQVNSPHNAIIVRINNNKNNFILVSMYLALELAKREHFPMYWQ